MFRNVIAGVDGRASGRDATTLAAALSTDALTLLCAYPADVVRSRASSAGFEELQHRDALAAVDIARAGCGRAATLLAIPDNDPAHALRQAAEERGADLIVVGSAHHGRLGRALLGDVGRATVHDAPCAVAVAPGHVGAGPPRRIAVGYDGSVGARAAVDVADRLAREHGAGLTVYVAWQAAPVVVPGATAYTADLGTEQQHEAEAKLEEILATLPAQTASGLLEGPAAAALVRAAGDHDLLVVGSRGRGALRRIALGSTSDRVMHHCGCATLIVPRPDGDVGRSVAAGAVGEHAAATGA